MKKLLNKIVEKIANAVQAKSDPVVYTDPVQEKNLSYHYQYLVKNNLSLPRLNEVGWKHYSQTDEDGILHFIFSIIGVTNKKCVEICASNAQECNTINLILNHYWTGLLFDGNKTNVDRGKAWLSTHRKSYVNIPKFLCEWITTSNINNLLVDNGFGGEIDLLSLDVDGVDYWLLEAIKEVSPRVIVLEYQQHLGPERSCTVPYQESFSAWDYPTTGWLPNYAGASLMAFKKLCDKKGYKLVGCNALCFNAFFIRRDADPLNLIPEVTVESCFHHPRVQWSIENRFPSVKDLPWVNI